MVSFSDFSTRAQSSFKVAETMEDLIASQEDAIHWVDPPEKAKSAFLQDVGGGAYIYKLHNAVFYPDRCLPPFFSQTIPSEIEVKLPKLADGLEYKSFEAPLLLTGAGEIFSESFGRNKYVPCLLSNIDFGELSNLTLPEVTIEVPDQSFYFELIQSHFGHVLVDVLGRFWLISGANREKFAAMRFVGGGYNKVNEGIVESTPDYLKKVIAACGLMPSQITISKQPTRFKELYVPSRIAPYYDSIGPRYNALMQMISEAIVPQSGMDSPQRIFLSRSRLGPGMRSLKPETEVLVEDYFKKRGFEIIHPQDLSFEEQISTVRHAKFVAGLVGSQLHLAVFLKSAAPKMFRICPKFHWNGIDGAIMQSVGGALHSFHAVDFGRSAEEEHTIPKFHRSWGISPEDLLRLESEIDKWLES